MSDRYVPILIAACPVVRKGEHHTTIATRVPLDEMVDRAAKALDDHLRGSGDWSAAAPGLARVALVAALGDHHAPAVSQKGER